MLRPKRLLIEPHTGFPMGAFKEKNNTTIFPGYRNIDLALIPRGAEVVLWRLREKWDFYLTGLGEMAAQFRAKNGFPRRFVSC